MTVRDSITRTGARTPGAEDYPTSMAAHGRASLPTQRGITEVASTCATGRHKPNIRRCMPGAGLSRPIRGKVLSYMPAFRPYRGKPAVRNDREGSRKRRHHSKPDPRLDSTRLSGDGKRSVAAWPKLPRPSSTLREKDLKLGNLVGSRYLPHDDIYRELRTTPSLRSGSRFRFATSRSLSSKSRSSEIRSS